jgi:hypothetical protein
VELPKSTVKLFRHVAEGHVKKRAFLLGHAEGSWNEARSFFREAGSAWLPEGSNERKGKPPRWRESTGEDSKGYVD